MDIDDYSYRDQVGGQKASSRPDLEHPLATDMPDRMGIDIGSLFQQGQSPDEIADQLADEYGIGKSRAVKMVNQWQDSSHSNPMHVKVAQKKSQYLNMNKPFNKLLKSFIDDGYDDKDIIDYCNKEQIEIQKRSKILSLDYAAKQDVVVDVCRELWEKEFYIPEIIVSLQANSPEVDNDLLKKSIESFEKLPTVNGCKELVCINSNGKQNGSIRIMTYKTVFQKTLSTYLGTFTKDLVDIHTQSDLDTLKIEK